MFYELRDSIPDTHRLFLQNLIGNFSKDRRFAGIGIGGSYLTDSMDEFSDLDLVCFIESEDYDEVMSSRKSLAASAGNLLSGFTGEHVGVPRILICLFDDPLIHVDFDFTDIKNAGDRNENPAILWERDDRLSKIYQSREMTIKGPDLQWIEDRYWVWMHYVAVKMGRGELFEVVDALSFVRRLVLGPLILMKSGYRPYGVRRIESAAPEYAGKLRNTIAGYDTADCFRALKATIDIYRELRSGCSNIELRDKAEKAAVNYVDKLEKRLSIKD